MIEDQNFSNSKGDKTKEFMVIIFSGLLGKTPVSIRLSATKPQQQPNSTLRQLAANGSRANIHIFFDSLDFIDHRPFDVVSFEREDLFECVGFWPHDLDFVFVVRDLTVHLRNKIFKLPIKIKETLDNNFIKLIFINMCNY